MCNDEFCLTRFAKAMAVKPQSRSVFIYFESIVVLVIRSNEYKMRLRMESAMFNVTHS